MNQSAFSKRPSTLGARWLKICSGLSFFPNVLIASTACVRTVVSSIVQSDTSGSSKWCAWAGPPTNSSKPPSTCTHTRARKISGGAQATQHATRRREAASSQRVERRPRASRRRDGTRAARAWGWQVTRSNGASPSPVQAARRHGARGGARKRRWCEKVSAPLQRNCW